MSSTKPLPKPILQHFYEATLSTLVQAMAWCLVAPSHCLNQYWHNSSVSYSITRGHWLISVYVLLCGITAMPGIILCMCWANERWPYIVTASLIGWVHTQNDPCKCNDKLYDLWYQHILCKTRLHREGFSQRSGDSWHQPGHYVNLNMSHFFQIYVSWKWGHICVLIAIN